MKTKKYIYRIVSSETSKTSDHSLTFRHPYVWNLCSDQSWKDKEDEILASKTGLICPSHFMKMFKIKNLHLPIPTKEGLHDPFEGFICKNIRLNSDSCMVDVEGMVSNNIRSLCFSYIECSEDRIEEKIENHIKQTSGYGKELKDYLYAEFNEELFANITHDVAVHTQNRIGSIVLTPNYFSKNQDQIDIPAPHNLTNPLIGKEGVMFHCSPNKREIMIYDSHGKPEFTEQELATFRDSIEEACPLKYYPIYIIEREVRFLIYSFEGWKKNDEIEIPYKYANSFTLKKYQGEFN